MRFVWLCFLVFTALASTASFAVESPSGQVDIAFLRELSGKILQVNCQENPLIEKDLLLTAAGETFENYAVVFETGWILVETEFTPGQDGVYFRFTDWACEGDFDS
jgi:hypothetical protein